MSDANNRSDKNTREDVINTLKVPFVEAFKVSHAEKSRKPVVHSNVELAANLTEEEMGSYIRRPTNNLSPFMKTALDNLFSQREQELAERPDLQLLLSQYK